ncbi:MAG: metallophosphoesterase [Flavobacteriaceae bacterium]
MIDLGALEGPLLIFGGPCSNLQATQAVRTRAQMLGIAPERCICTGDIAAYCAHPRETTDLVRDWGCHVVMGNCEESLASEADDCGCGFAEGTACDVLSRKWYAHASGALDAENRAWMGGLPRQIKFTLGGLNVVVIHGAFDRINRYVFASSPEADKSEQAARAGADIIIASHSGIPFTQHLADGRIWHNAGIVGIPANDGTTDTWYSLLHLEGGAPRFEHCRLAYDHQTAAAAMRRAGLADGYARALETGLWPSLDVLPAKERGETGRRIDGV